jgi:hypothetical protein
MPSPRDRPPASSSASVDYVDPAKVRVLEFVPDEADEMVRFDCYHPDADAPEETSGDAGRLVRLNDGLLQVRALRWTQSASRTPSVRLQWTCTGLHADEVARIRVRPWPHGAPVRTFRPPEPV